MTPFEGLESEYSQLSYLKSQELLVEPNEYVIGWQQTYVNDPLKNYLLNSLQVNIFQLVKLCLC